MSERPFHLSALRVGDEPASWAAAGFAVENDRVRIADTTVHLVGGDDRGIIEASVDGWRGAIDGMPFTGGATATAAERADHENGVTGFDHLVAMSPDMDRTQTALAEAGFEHRRTRTFEMGGRTNRQAFYWLGSVILELAGSDDAHGDGPANLWGLALTCEDLDGAKDRLGDRLGDITPAVQKGRRIATVRTRELGVSVPIALMSPHAPAN